MTSRVYNLGRYNSIYCRDGSPEHGFLSRHIGCAHCNWPASPLIRAGEDQPEELETMQQFVSCAASALAASWDIGIEHGQEVPYWDSHGLNHPAVLLNYAPLIR